MTPNRFTVKNGITTFHYQISRLREFVSEGLKHGNVGMILVKREGELITYKGFGTIENPCNIIRTFCIQHCPTFSGDMPTDEERLIPPESMFKDCKLVFLDISTVDVKKFIRP